jgi:TonB family protein
MLQRTSCYHLAGIQNLPPGTDGAIDEVMPFSPEDGSTEEDAWATHPLRKSADQVPDTVPADPPVLRPAVPLQEATGGGSSTRKWVWLAVAAAVLAFVFGGFWGSRHQGSPAKVQSVSVTPSAQVEAPEEPPAAVPAIVDKETPAPPVTSAAPPTSPPAQNAMQSTQRVPEPAQKVSEPVQSRKRTPLPEEPASASGPLEPMKPGDLIRAGQPGVEPAEIQSFPSYSYPAVAKGTGQSVSIRVAVLVSETGRVLDAQLRDGDNSGLGFNEAALAAARKVRFFPATRDGVAGKMWSELLFEFAE